MTSFDRRRAWLLSALLALAVLALYGQSVEFGFVYDDTVYVTQNAMVARGLSQAGLKWAFTSLDANWHPLTWLAHMLDVSLFGMSSGAPHAVNAVWHAANSVLVLFVLASATGKLMPSAIVAALFALHPTHVESVAWISERKDVLSTFFALAALGMYVRWSRSKSPREYTAILVLFALGLLSKPTLVTLPCAMLLFDFWPLARTHEGWKRLLLEKLPLFAMSAALSIVTVIAQREAHAVGSLGLIPLGERIENAVWSYVEYLRQFVWPSGLACFYPHPLGSLGLAKVAFASALIVAISLAAIRLRARAPYVLFGWCWFLGTLVPMIGLVQVGGQAYADRYSYLSSLGLSIAIVFAGAALVERGVIQLRFALLAASGWLALLAIVAFGQISVWKNGETLFGHACKVTGENWIAESGLGFALAADGRHAEALPHLQAALALQAGFPSAQTALLKCLMALGRFDDAEKIGVAWSKRYPEDAANWVALAAARFSRADLDGALEASAAALALRPDWASYWNRRGRDLLLAGRTAQALDAFERASRFAPNQTEFADDFVAAKELAQHANADSRSALALRAGLAGDHRELARAFVVRRELDLARKELELAVALDPTSLAARAELGDLFMLLEDDEHAVEQWTAALSIDPRNASLHDRLGVSASKKSNWDAAIRHFEAALALDPNFEAARTNLLAAQRRRSGK